MKLVFALLILLSSPLAVAQEKVRRDHIHVQFIAPHVFSSSEETLMGLFFQPDPEWHVYWKNPGDSGAAPKFNLTSKQAEIGPILWPTPERLPIAHLTNLGYHGPVLYLFTVKPQSNSSLQILADLEWLVCKVECVPGFAKLKLQRPIRDGTTQWKDNDFDLIQKFAQKIPQSANDAPLQISSLKIQNETLYMKIEAPVNLSLKDLSVFPVNGEWISPAIPELHSETQTFAFKLASAIPAPPVTDFVIATPYQTWEFKNIPVSTATTTKTTTTEALWILILSSILGGFILNLMPCVFPVISIKAFSLLKVTAQERKKDCLLYTAGILFCFSVIGITFLIIRSGGTMIGWGFQLQSPIVILGLILLFWLMALNFLGTFEMGTGIMNVAGRYLKGSSSFGTGVLSVFVAAPCTGPFMGTALGATSLLSAFSAFLIFLSLGIGLSLPFMIFAFFPKVLSWLPKPGVWMQTLKQFFAFPLFATVIWLMWVLGQQAGTQGWFFASLALFVVSFAIWFRRIKKLYWSVLIVAMLCLIAISYQLSIEPLATRQQQTASSWHEFDENKISALRAQKQAVFVDFTAAWCITCQLNKQTVLDTNAGQEIFSKKNIFLMRADWTRYDPKITAALAQLGRNSVPVYVFYPADGSAPRLLPQILTLSMIENL